MSRYRNYCERWVGSTPDVQLINNLDTRRPVFEEFSEFIGPREIAAVKKMISLLFSGKDITGLGLKMIPPLIAPQLGVGRSLEYLAIKSDVGFEKGRTYVINGVGVVKIGAEGQVVLSQPWTTGVSDIFAVSSGWIDRSGVYKTGVNKSRVGSLETSGAQKKFALAVMTQRLLQLYLDNGLLFTSTPIAWGSFIDEPNLGWFCYKFYPGIEPANLLDRSGESFRDLNIAVFELGKALRCFADSGVSHEQPHMGNWRIIENKNQCSVAIKDMAVRFKKDYQSDEQWFLQVMVMIEVVISILMGLNNSRRLELITQFCFGFIDPFNVFPNKREAIIKLLRTYNSSSSGQLPNNLISEVVGLYFV